MKHEQRPGKGRKIGELANAAGVTIRTLHYYDQIGLLTASARTDAGHRLYSDGDVERLYRICLLRRLGLPLAEIGQTLDDPAWNLHAAMSTHLETVDRRLAAESRLRSRLAGLVVSTESAEQPLTNDLLEVLEDMTMLETTVQRRISILVYEDLEAAHDYLTEVFGLGPGEITRDEAGRALPAELQAGDGVIWLHPESPKFALSSPKSLGAATAMTAVIVDDVDAHHRHAAEKGAVIDYEPVDQPYGYRE